MTTPLQLPPFATSAWTTYTIALDPAAWNTTPAVFEQIPANVTELRISVEALFGAEVQAIDNLVLAPGPTPATAVPFGAGCGPYTLAAATLPWIGTTFVTGNNAANTQLALQSSPAIAGAVCWHQVVTIRITPAVVILSVGATNGLELRIGAF
jgi:hypothetical protein